MADDFFAPPPFNVPQALVQLQRSLRELRALVQRGDGFELQGKRVIEWRSDESHIALKLAKQPARTPEFDTLVLKDSADLRRGLDEVRKRLARWTEE